MSQTRTRTALLGCLGVTMLGFGGLYVTLQRMRRTQVERMQTVAREGGPCIREPDLFRPVLVGDSAHIEVGTKDGPECTPQDNPGFQWSSADASVVDMRPNGVAVGKTPGVFTATARRGDSTVSTTGFVLPAEWEAKIRPDIVKLRVGDSVTMVVRAVDKTGAPLPVVPYGIFTPEFFDPSTRKKPIVNQPAWQNATEPVVVIATDTGTTMLVGRIGFQQVTARLTVAPRR